jgi:hypothetical protein
VVIIGGGIAGVLVGSKVAIPGIRLTIESLRLGRGMNETVGGDRFRPAGCIGAMTRSRQGSGPKGWRMPSPVSEQHP